MAMQARISTIEGDAGKIDDAIKINEKIMPALKALEGFRAANFLVDRSAGKLVAVDRLELVTYDRARAIRRETR
jgi:hypothetical protein